MKNLKKLLMTFIGIIAVAMCVTSCLNSDDDSIDAVTQNRYQKLMSGMYSGKARFYQLKSTRSFSSQKTYVKYDSIHTSWDVNADSTFRINNFPVFMLDSAVVVEKSATGTEAEKYRALNQAIRALKNSSEGYLMWTKARYVIPSTSWVSENVIQFYVQPYTIERTINFDGADHKVYFVFSPYTTGAFSATNRKFQAQLALSAVCIDKLDSSHTVPSQFMNSIVVTLSD